MTGRYVAIGSSMASGPGIEPRVPGSPRPAGRSTLNYPHLVAERMGYDLVDVTYSGATTANVLAERQHDSPAQVEALDGSEALVTVTIGGNDVGYVPSLFVAGLPKVLRRLALFFDGPPDAIEDCALVEVAESLKAVGHEVRRRAPRARVLFTDYLTLLPPPGTPARPLAESDVEAGRRIGAALEQLTAAAAEVTGCEVVRAGEASRAHHPWSADPWTTRPGLPWPRRPMPLHPNATGMRAVADLVVEKLS